MAKASIPVFDICTIDQQSQKDLLVARFSTYLEQHYRQLHRPHGHSFYHLVFFTKGKGSHTIDFKRFPVKPYQVYFMVPGQVHSWDFDGNEDGYIIHFTDALLTSFLLNSQYLERYYFFRGNVEDSVCQLPAAQGMQLIPLFESMLAEAAAENGQHLNMVRLRLLELFITVDRYCTPKKAQAVPQQKLQLLRTFRQLIDKNYRTLKLPKEYAELLYITPNHLNALTQDLLGKTAGDLIRERILLEAKRLLTNADMTAAGIAHELNFKDNSYFSRVFRKSEGITPDEFRRSFINK